jgi:hypothetical protein
MDQNVREQILAEVREYGHQTAALATVMVLRSPGSPEQAAAEKALTETLLKIRVLLNLV